MKSLVSFSVTTLPPQCTRTSESAADFPSSLTIRPDSSVAFPSSASACRFTSMRQTPYASQTQQIVSSPWAVSASSCREYQILVSTGIASLNGQLDNLNQADELSAHGPKQSADSLICLIRYLEAQERTTQVTQSTGHSIMMLCGAQQ